MKNNYRVQAMRIRHLFMVVMLLGFGSHPSNVVVSQESMSMYKNSAAIRSLEIGAFVMDVAFSPDGFFLAAGGANAQVTIWNTSNWTVRYELRQTDAVNVMAFSPSGEMLAVATTRDSLPSLSFWDMRNGKELGSYVEPSGAPFISAISFSADNEYLAIGMSGGKVKLLNVERPSTPKVINDGLVSFDTGISSLKFSPDSRMLAVAAGTGVSGPKDFGRLSVIDVVTGKFALTKNLRIVYDVAFSPDGSVLAVSGVEPPDDGASSRSLVLLRTTGWDQIHKFANYAGGEGLEFLPGGRLLASADPLPPDSAVVIVDRDAKKVVRNLKLGPPLTSFALSASGGYIAVGDEEGRVTVFPSR